MSDIKPAGKEWVLRSDLIASYMTHLLRRYNSIRGKKCCVGQFWDAVVITAADEAQADCFRYQIEMKRKQKDIPTDAAFHVVADIAGHKAGSGGSLFYALDHISTIYGEKAFDMRVLLICAGGWSQRLPTASLLGKLFLPLPLGDMPYQMLDLKLALYLPFLQPMKPGILVTCSDDVETYYLPSSLTEDKYWSFKKGFTALAHVSTLDIAKHHGVYVIPNENVKLDQAYILSVCRLVLQKPSETVMAAQGAIISDELAFTDSIFMLDAEVAQKLLQFYSNHKPLTCEIDAYGDFLQCLGDKASADFIYNDGNALFIHNSLQSTREKIFKLLNGTQFNILLLPQSAFYHLGTMEEYVQGMTSHNSLLFKELGFQPWTFSTYIGCNAGTNLLQHNATVMHSALHCDTFVGNGTVIEYCKILSPVKIGANCLISHCCINHVSLETDLVIPPGCCFHTMCIVDCGICKYVTCVFGIKDDLKGKVIEGNLGSGPTFLGKSLLNVLRVLRFKESELFIFQDNLSSLWSMRAFYKAKTMEESFQATLTLVRKVLESDCAIEYVSDLNIDPGQFISMQEAITMKDIKSMMEFREHLDQIILPQLQS